MLRKTLAMFLVFGLIAGFIFSDAVTYAAAGDPGKIEAEDYTAMYGIQTEPCSEGGRNIGYVEAGDWMEYSVNIQNTAVYNVEFRVSSPYAGTRLQLLSGTSVLADVTVPNTGGWQNWQTVSAPVNLQAGSRTLRVQAATNGWNLNWINITSGAAQQVETPVLSPGAGTYTSAQSVTISCATAGAAIKYTTDGSTPTASSATYSGPVSIARSATIKAIAVKAGMSDSNVAAAAYVINIPSGGKAIPGKIEAESYDSMYGVDTQPCSEGGENVGWIEAGDYMNYNVDVAQTGTYTVQFRLSTPNASGTVQLRSGNTVLATGTVTNSGGWQNWKTVTAAAELTAGAQTLTLYAATGGFNINWVNFIYGEPVPQVATPVFSPAGGTYPTAQDVTISCATAGATIKYTVDGTTPTSSSQTYTGPVRIAATTSLKAVAIKAGMLDSELAGATYNISGTSNGVMDFEIKNGTRNTYADSEIYWAVLGLNSDKKLCYLDANGNLVPTSTALNDAPGHLTKNGQNYANIYHKISEVPLVSTPAVSSGRMYLSVGSPCYIKVFDNGYAGPDVNNPTDPNNDIYWDFVEFTLDAGGYHGNTTRVDAFGFPITHRLICADGYDRTVGETETREALFNEYQNEVPDEFKTLVKAPYRILAPCKGGFKAGGPYANYFDSYVNQVWHESTPKPTTQDIFLGIGGAADPKICAALNRGVYTDPAHWANSDYFYQLTPSNFYSKFWHDHSIDGLSYGFCYDDVNNYAAYLEHNNPVRLVITVGW